MGIRTDPADPTLHHIDCRPDGYKGKRVREDFRGSREEAEEYYRVLMRRPMSRNLPRPMTLKAMWPEYIQWMRTNRAASTADNVRLTWDVHLAEFFGNLQPKHLTRALIEQYKQRRLGQTKWGKAGAAPPKPRTITKELHYLSGMIAWAVRMDYCDPLPFRIEGFPARMTRAPAAHPLTAEQVQALLGALSPRYHAAFLLMVDAGLRATEAMTLKREQVDLGRGLLYIVGKGNKERIVPIATARLRAALESAVPSPDGYLTVNPRTNKPYLNIKKPLSTAARRAGITQHVYQHLLRHTFGTLATVANVGQASLQRIMGHSSPTTTGIYQTLAAEQLRQAAANFGAMIDGCPHGQLDTSHNPSKSQGG